MTSSLAAASFVVLAELAAAYFYLYSLYKRPYFAWMALGWGANTAYVYAEALVGYPLTSNVRVILTGVNALSLLPFYLAAMDLRRRPVRARTYILGGIAVVLAASVLLLARSQDTEDWREPILLSVIAVLFAAPLVMLTQSFATSDATEILRILRNESEGDLSAVASRGTYGDLGDSAETSPEVRRILGWTQTLLVISCSVYALVQLCYPLAITSHWTLVPTYWIVFGLALLTKVLRICLPLEEL